MSATKEQILEALRKVKDPELHRDIVTLNMVKNIAVCDGIANLKIELTTPACPMKDVIQKDVTAAVLALPGMTQVNVEFSANVASKPPQQRAAESNPLPNVKHIIAVGAGKGGVGKSTVAVNLAVGLAREGATVGLMDGDVYGPSLPTMLGIGGKQPMADGNRLLPFEVHGLRSMTIGALVPAEKPLIWRGPMAQGAFKQLIEQTEWGTLDYLIIDLPPGTGDVPLTMAQMLPLTGAVVVCTPQRVAQDDARRAIRMFQQLQVDVLGVVENMSYFIGDDGKEYDIFGKGGAATMAEDMGVPLLGTLPINTAIRRNSDGGNPTANFTGDKLLAKELMEFVRNVAGQVSVKTLRGDGAMPTLSIS
jgi:ATP-binding protein involved in chromosome partitioning